MSEKTLKFGDVKVNKKEFHAFKHVSALNLVDTDKVVISDKFERSNNGSKYFIGYADDSIIRSLCIDLPQMSGYIKYVDNGRKNISFKIEEDTVLVKYNEIRKKIKNELDIKFQSKPSYDEKYIKVEVKTFNDS